MVATACAVLFLLMANELAISAGRGEPRWRLLNAPTADDPELTGALRAVRRIVLLAFMALVALTLVHYAVDPSGQALSRAASALGLVACCAGLVILLRGGPTSR